MIYVLLHESLYTSLDMQIDIFMLVLFTHLRDYNITVLLTLFIPFFAKSDHTPKKNVSCETAVIMYREIPK